MLGLCQMKPPYGEVVFSAFLFWHTVSSPGWYARTSGCLLRKINFQMKILCQKTSYGIHDLFFILMFHFCSTRTGEQVTTHSAPYTWKALIQLGAAWCPEGVISDCYCHFSAIQSLTQCLTSWLWWTKASFAVQRHYPPPWQKCHGLNFGGVSVL